MFWFLNEFNVFEGCTSIKLCTPGEWLLHTKPRFWPLRCAGKQRWLRFMCFYSFLMIYNQDMSRHAKFNFKSVIVNVPVREAAFYLLKLAQLPWPRAWFRVHISKIRMNVWCLKRLNRGTKKNQKNWKLQHIKKNPFYATTMQFLIWWSLWRGAGRWSIWNQSYPRLHEAVPLITGLLGECLRDSNADSRENQVHSKA